MDIVKILGVGLSGFGFLLMYLAYRLILKMMPDPKPNATKVINRYMLICFVMTLAVGTFTYFSTVYKKDIISAQTEQIAKQDTAITMITATQKNNTLTDTLLYYANTGDAAKADKAKDDQKKTLDSLGNYFNNNGNTKEAVKFNVYKDSVLKFTELIGRKDIPKNEKDLYQQKYIDYNNAISKLTFQKVGFQKAAIKTN